MLIGVTLMILGVILPLLMVVKVVTPTFLLSFVAYACQLLGMVLAFWGLFTYVKIRRQ